MTPEVQLFFYTAETPIRFLVVDKKAQQLQLFEQTSSLQRLNTFPCATGENPGTKEVSGDSKTPVGVYFITEIYEDNKITVFGSRAFHLDYPNIFDLNAGHNGDGIFIHGTNKELVPFSSNGCITLKNSDLDLLAPYLRVKDVPIIIVESLQQPIENTAKTLLKNSPEFIEVLSKLKVPTDNSFTSNVNALFSLTIGSKAMAAVYYDMSDENNVKYQYNKRSYLTSVVPGNWRSLYSVDSQLTVPHLIAQQTKKITNPAVSSAPMVTPQPPSPTVLPVPARPVNIQVAKTAKVIKSELKPKITTRPGEKLLVFVDNWRDAWQKKDLEAYMRCYSPTFTSGNLDINGWRAKKRYLNQKYDYIKVTIDNIIVEWTGSGANVTFSQTYQSDKLKTSGTKTLNLIKRNNRWMIDKEIM